MNKEYNLTENQDESWAVHLPALSAFYVHQLSKLDNDPNYYGKDRWNPNFENGHVGLNWMKEEGYFRYKWGLYSAGHANLDLTKSAKTEKMIHDREKGSILIADSGGFQLAGGVGHFKNVNWSDFAGKGGDKIRESVLRWSEEVSEYAMTLDVPAFAIHNPKTGLNTFEDTLRLSVINLDYYIKNRNPEKCKILNVLSGTDNSDSQKWFDEVIKYSDPEQVKAMGYDVDRTFEGYAFAGINMRNMQCTMTRFAHLIELGLLNNKKWIHFLGIGRLDWACYLTAIQREIRKHYSDDLTVSFDCASAFLATAKGQMYTHPSFTSKRFGYNMRKAVDNRDLKGSQQQMPFGGAIASRMTLGDMCRLGHGEPNKLGKIGKTSWDNGSYLLAMASNVYIHVSAVQEANRLADYEYINYNLDYRNWTKERKSSQANEVSGLVPANILFFKDYVEKFFDPAKTLEDRLEMIEDNLDFLESISFGRKKSNNFGDLFDMGSALDSNDEDAIDEISTYENVPDIEEEDDE